MGFSQLLRTEAALVTFRARFNIPLNVDITYYHESSIENDRRPHVVFFPLMAILEGEVRFPMDPLLLRTHRFYGLWPNQLPPNFYRVVSCVSRLNNLYNLCLDHRDINFMYNMHGNLRSGYYLKVWDTMVWLILCLLDYNRNSTREYIKVSGNWLADELTCPTSPWEIGWYLFCVCVWEILLLGIIFLLLSLFFFCLTPMFLLAYVNIKCFKLDPNAIHAQDLNSMLRSEIFVHYDG